MPGAETVSPPYNGVLKKSPDPPWRLDLATSPLCRCTRRFDPVTALAMPRSVRAMLGPKPRVIAEDTWAKLPWAGLNHEANDLADAGIRAYPLKLVRALTLTWLFACQHSDEIVRLHVGWVRWQQNDGADTVTPMCLLDIPVHKTGTAQNCNGIMLLCLSWDGISCSLLNTSPARSTRAVRVLKARLPNHTGLSPSSSSRCIVTSRNGPYEIAGPSMEGLSFLT